MKREDSRRKVDRVPRLRDPAMTNNGGEAATSKHRAVEPAIHLTA
jgi:hypothetical protein